MAKKQLEEQLPAKNELVIYMEENQLPTEIQKKFLEKFGSFIEQSKEWSEKGKSLVITSIDQIEEMNQARVGRLALKNIRTSIEKTRKAEKEESLQYGKMVDSVAKFLTGLVEPTELHLEEQEKFIEREEAKVKAALLEERLALLAPFNVETQFYDLANMDAVLFGQLLKDSEMLFNAKKVQAEKEEQEKLIESRYSLRVSELIQKDFYFQDEFYIHKYSNEKNIIRINVAWLKEVEEGIFKSVFEDLKYQIQEIKKQKDEAAQIEAERLAKELADTKKAAQVAQEKNAYRLNKIVNLGLKFDFSKNSYTHVSGIEFTPEQIKADEDEFFEQRINGLASRIQEYNIKLDLLAKIVIERKKQLFVLGFAETNGQMVFQDLKIPFDILIKSTEAQWIDYLKVATDSVGFIKQTLEDARIAAEKLAQEEADAAKGDKVKFNELIEELRLSGKKHTFKSKKSQKLYSEVQDLIGKIINHIQNKQ